MEDDELLDVNSPEGQAAIGVAAETAPAPAAPTTPTTPTTPKPDDAAVGARGQSLSGDSLATRLTRERETARRAVLKAEYGTDDEAEIKRIKAEREEAEKERQRLKRLEEARKKTRLTAEQRQQSELAALRAKTQELEQKLKEKDRQVLSTQQETKISAIAQKFVRPERYKYVRRDLSEHIKSLAPEKRKAFNEKALERWMENFVKENPDFAVAPSTTEAKPDAKPPEVKPVVPPRQRPVTTAKPPAPPRAAGAGTGSGGDPDPLKGKTPLPGKPNSMTKAELREYAKRQGVNYPS